MKHHILRSFSLVFVSVLFSSADNCSAENWPGWRGPNRNGVTTDTGVPTTWSATDNVLWKMPLPGIGTSNPVVWGDKVLVTASEGRDQGELHVICFDRDTGRERWHHRLWGTAPTLFYGRSGMASPSPVTDGKRLFAFFGTGDVFCFDLDGGLLWQRAIAEEYGPFENRFAAASSPLLFEDKLIVQCDHYGASYVIALDQQTGANRWKSDRPEVWLSWSSPQLVPNGDRFELVLSGSEKLDGYDPRTGSRLWTLRGLARVRADAGNRSRDVVCRERPERDALRHQARRQRRHYRLARRLEERQRNVVRSVGNPRRRAVLPCRRQGDRLVHGRSHGQADLEKTLR